MHMKFRHTRYFPISGFTMHLSAFYVAVVLMSLYAVPCLGQNVTSSNDNSTSHGSGSSSSGTDTPSSVSSSFTFDCRRGMGNCLNGGSCQSDDGKCLCSNSSSTDDNYQCIVKTPTTECKSPSCGKSGFCQKGSCVCPESFYGEDCKYDRALVVCLKDKMLVNVNPYGTFPGMIYVLGNTACSFQLINKTDITEFTAALDLTARKVSELQGWAKVIPFVADATGCGATMDKDIHTAKIYVQYSNLFKSFVDQIITAKCIIQANASFPLGAAIANVTDSDGAVSNVDASGKVEIVTMTILDKNGQLVRSPIILGDFISLVFNMTISNGSEYTDFILTECTANNSKSGSDLKSFTFLKNGCPTEEAIAIVTGEPETTFDPSYSSVTTVVRVRTFMFVGSGSVGFVCQLQLCTNNSTTCDIQGPCSWSSTSHAQSPANSGSSDKATNTTNSPNSRRKRETGDKEVSVGNVVSVIDPQSRDSTETPNQTQSIAECMNNPDVTAVVVILGVCVFLLLVVTGVLIIRVLQSRKKKAAAQPTENPRPVETLRFPRLDSNTLHTNSF